MRATKDRGSGQSEHGTWGQKQMRGQRKGMDGRMDGKIWMRKRSERWVACAVQPDRGRGGQWEVDAGQ